MNKTRLNRLKTIFTFILYLFINLIFFIIYNIDMKIKDLEKQYKEKQLAWKIKIRLEPDKFKRFLKWVWYFVAFPFVWLFYNIRDWRSAICVIISFTLWSASVWAFYLAGLLCGWTSTDIGKWLIGIGSAVWAWWLSPAGSPFILIVTATSIALKSLLNLISKRRSKNEKNRNSETTERTD